MIKVDQTTLLSLKGKFARVCVNIDFTEPLPGPLVISFKGKSMKVPLIYEGLYEVCALCGFESHQIEACPNKSAYSKVEIVVEKFGGTSGQSTISVTQPSSSASEPITVTNKWIRVSPKKRFRSMSSAGVGKSSPLKAPLLPKITLVEPIMSPILSPKVLGSTKSEALDKSFSATYEEGIFLAHSTQGVNEEVPVNEDPLNAIEVDVLVVPNDNLYEDPQEFQGNEEDMVDTFLNLDLIQDLEMSSESSKKRKVEEGDEGLSRADA